MKDEKERRTSDRWKYDVYVNQWADKRLEDAKRQRFVAQAVGWAFAILATFIAALLCGSHRQP